MNEANRQVVVITGARGSVGAAIAQELAPGARIALLDRRAAQETADAHALHLGGVDMADESAAQRALARVRAHFGPPQALVHTVGAYLGGLEVAEQSNQTLRDLLEANYLSAASMVRAVLPDLLGAGAGTIVLFASADAYRARAGGSAYAAAKAALLRFSEALAEEVCPRGVSVRVIVPTIVDTPQNRAAMPNARFADWVSPEEIARTVAFLLSPAASGIRYAALPMGR